MPKGVEHHIEHEDGSTTIDCGRISDAERRLSTLMAAWTAALLLGRKDQ